MTSLQELTDKIYAEGVEKGNAKAEELVAAAQEKAAAIVAAAEKEAAEKVAAAEARAAELDKNTRAELKLYADQSISAIKTAITDLLSDQIASDAVKAATADKAFMQKLIVELASNLANGGNVTIQVADAEDLKAMVAGQAKAMLEKGIKIEEVKGQKVSFVIAPAKGGYKLAFGDAELVAYFKEYLRPQLIELLF